MSSVLVNLYTGKVVEETLRKEQDDQAEKRGIEERESVREEQMRLLEQNCVFFWDPKRMLHLSMQQTKLKAL